MNSETIQSRVETIKQKRDVLLDLLENPNLGTLRIDVNQALEEVDELIEEFERTFPKSATLKSDSIDQSSKQRDSGNGSKSISIN